MIGDLSHRSDLKAMFVACKLTCIRACVKLKARGSNAARQGY